MSEGSFIVGLTKGFEMSAKTINKDSDTALALAVKLMGRDLVEKHAEFFLDQCRYNERIQQLVGGYLYADSDKVARAMVRIHTEFTKLFNRNFTEVEGQKVCQSCFEQKPNEMYAYAHTEVCEDCSRKAAQRMSDLIAGVF
jgi:hypothetical protein